MILDLVDQRLRMLHTHAESKSLCLDGPALAVEHLVDVACGMTCGKDHLT